MAHERFHPSIHPDPREYIAEGENRVEKSRRQHDVLRHAFNGLAEDYRDATYAYTEEHYLGDFRSFFRDVPLPNGEPELRIADTSRRTFLRDWDNFDKAQEFAIYYFSEQERITVGHSTGVTHIFSPVGDYGPDLSIAVVQSARSLISLVDLIKNQCDEVNQTYAEVIDKGTFFKDAYVTMQEAAGTIAASFSLAAFNKVEGYENDPVGLLGKCIEDNTFVSMSTLSPFATILPMASTHIAFPQGLVRKPDGSVALAKESIAFLRKERFARGMQKGGEFETFGCPAATSGVNLMADVFHKAFQYHYENPASFPNNPVAKF